MKPPDEVNRFVVSKPTCCEACGTLLLGEDPCPQRHQVCELPPIVPEIIEYQVHTLACLHCGHETTAEPVAEAQAHVQQQQQVNVDETSWAKHNKKQWLWTATTPLVTVFLIMASRRAAAAKQLLGQQIAAVIGSDRFSAYNWLDSSRRQLCWAHSVLVAVSGRSRQPCGPSSIHLVLNRPTTPPNVLCAGV